MKKRTRIPAPGKRSTAPVASEQAQPTPAVRAPEEPQPGIAAQLDTGARLGHSFGALDVQSAPAGVIQPKLTVGAADDTYEEDADKVAGQVMRMTDADVQRKLAGAPGDKEEHEDDRPADRVMRKRDAGGASEAGDAVEQRIAASKGGGAPLPEATRSFMEPRFGADFGGVRVHADAEAHQLNQDLSARAFTTGQDIFFKQGEYSPSSAGGQALLAHELTHVLQQGGTPSGVNPGAISSPGKRAVQRMMGRPKVQGGGGKKGGDGKENEKKGGEQKKPIFGEELLKARGAWEREMEEVQGWTIEAAQKLAWTTVKYTAYYLQKDQMPDENLTQLIQDCLDWHQLFSSMWEEIDQHWAILSENQAQFPEQERQRAIAWNTAVRAASSSMMQYVVSLLGFLQRIEAERAKTSHNLAKAAKSTSAALPPDWLNAQQSAIPGNVRLGTHLVQQGLSLADLLNVLHMMRSGSLPPPQQGNQMGQGSSSEGEE